MEWVKEEVPQGEAPKDDSGAVIDAEVEVEEEEGTEKKPRKKVRARLVQQQGNKREFLKKLWSVVGDIPAHVFGRDWQATQRRADIDVARSLRGGVLMVEVDYSMDYEAVERNEVQSALWSRAKIMLLVFVVHFCTATGEFVSETHTFLSSPRSKAAPLVFRCLRTVVDRVLPRMKDGRMKRLSVWSDNCTTFKCATMCRLLGELSVWAGCGATWSFPEPGHGKSLYDAEGGVIKKWLSRLKKQPNKAAEAHAALAASKLVKPKSNKNSATPICQRFFYLIPDDAELEYERPFPGIRNAAIMRRRSVCAGLPWQAKPKPASAWPARAALSVGMRDLSCGCPRCEKGEWKRCKRRRAGHGLLLPSEFILQPRPVSSSASSSSSSSSSSSTGAAAAAKPATAAVAVVATPTGEAAKGTATKGKKRAKSAPKGGGGKRQKKEEEEKATMELVAALVSQTEGSQVADYLAAEIDQARELEDQYGYFSS